MATPETPPQGEFNFDMLTIGELRDKYKKMVGIPPRFDINDDEQFLEQATTSQESADKERQRMREADAATDSGVQWWQK